MKKHHSKHRGMLIPGIAAVASVAAGAEAVAQEESPPRATVGDAQQVTEEVVVTGTALRGVAPVGSNLVTVDAEDIKATAATNVTELINTVPAITSAGSAPQGPNAYNHYAPSIHGIGGSSSNSTLVIADGLRMPGGGTQYVQPDPNTIPTPALERVEVLADGASSVYGSDAVSGVINFITRKTYDGFEGNLRYGFGDDYSNSDISGIIGRRWDTGGFYVAAQVTQQDALRNRDRPFIARGDYRDVGGSNTNSFNCLPATIRTVATGSGSIYASPTSATTIENDVSDNGFCNNSVFGNAIPEQMRKNVLATSYLEFGDRATLTTKVNYNEVETQADAAPGMGNSITVFGPGGSAVAGQANPFFMAPAGETTANREQVNFVLLRADGNYGSSIQEGDTFYGASVLEFALTDDWKIDVSVALGNSHNTREGRKVFCAACANLALNGTTQAGGSTTNSSVNGQSVISTQLPLTAANALDVWQGLGSNRTSPDVIKKIYSNNEVLTHDNTLQQYRLGTQAPIFSLPAGDTKVAFGVEYMKTEQRVEDLSTSAILDTGQASQFTAFTLQRDVKSAFAEMYIPVLESVETILSLRYDEYSDFGGTTNPKIALNWEPIAGVRLRGNYAESFVAPAMYQVGDPNRGYARGANGANVSGAIEVPVATYPEVLQLPGCATATVTCRVGTASNPGLTRSLGAGLEGTEPQLGESWSVGVDIALASLPNFAGSITYWNTKFMGATSVPAVELLLYSGALNDRLRICPTGCTPEEIRAFTNVDNGAPFNAVLPSTVYFLIDRNLKNLLNLDAAGIDAQLQYRFLTDAAGTFTLGGNVTYFTKYDQWFFDAPKFSILNTSGYNSQFPSIQTRGRVNLKWELGGLSTNLAANVHGSYRNWLQSSVMPITLDENGNPSGGGDEVDAAYTLDLNIGYQGTAGFMQGTRVYIDVKNLLDQEPAFYNGNTSGIGVGGWGFNGFVSNPLGRIMSVGFTIGIR